MYSGFESRLSRLNDSGSKGIERSTLGCMFEDRARVFIDGLGWPLTRDSKGHERDGYDNPESTYILVSSHTDSHAASIRLRSLSASNMTREIFFPKTILPGPDDRYLEATRFCISPRHKFQSVRLGKILVDRCKEIVRSKKMEGLVAVFDPRVFKLYSSIGWQPVEIDETLFRGRKVKMGLWQCD